MPRLLEATLLFNISECQVSLTGTESRVATIIKRSLLLLICLCSLILKITIFF